MAQYPGAAASDTTLYVGVNNKNTTLTSAIDAVVTTIPVTSTTGFPASGFISIDLEIIAYTSVNATNFLGATRAADGSTATTHAINSLVSHNIVAAHHNAPKDEIIAIETDLVGVQASLSDLAPANTASSVLTRVRQIVTQIKAITGTSNWYDAVGRTIASIVTLLGSSTTQILTPAGSASAPSHSFSGDPDTGIYSVAANTLGLAVNGVNQINVTTAAVVIGADQLLIKQSTAAVPGLTFNVSGATDTGLYNDGGDVIKFSAGGVLQVTIDVAQTAIQNGTVSVPALTFVTDPDSGLYRIGADNIALSTNGVRALEITSAQAVKIKGTATNDSATAGDVGQYVSSTVAAVSYPASATYGDVTSISLTAGDWDVTLNLLSTNLGGTAGAPTSAGVSTTSGNSTTGLVIGDNWSLGETGAGTNNIMQSVPVWRLSLSATTTVYGKFRADYSGTAPAAYARLSARRVR